MKINIVLDKLKHPFCGLGNFNTKFLQQLTQDKLFNKSYNLYINLGYTDKKLNISQHIITFFNNHLSFLHNKEELWYLSHQMSPFKFSNEHKIITTVHDMNFLFEKSGRKRSKYLERFKRNVLKTSYLIYISNFTKDIVERNVPETKNIKNKVIYNGVDFLERITSEKPPWLKTNKFFFTIGTIMEKKNFYVLVDILQRFPDTSLIIAGIKKDKTYANLIIDRAKKLNIYDRIIMPGGISDSYKKYLYINCEAFLFPSLYEGFGLPIIEALYFKKPVICSRSTAIPEIGKDYVAYFESFNPDHTSKTIKTHIEKINQSSESELQSLKDYAMTYNWSNTYKQYKKVFNEFLLMNFNP